jgi:site-specific DNA recombinase
MTTTYLASVAQANVANALYEINEHATLSGSGLCRVCQVEGPCARRNTAERTLRSCNLLPQRSPGVTRPELIGLGVHFRSATERFDTSSAAGRLFVQMLGAFAEFEREVIIDRVISGMERKAANGQWTHGPRPYGYQADPSTHRLIPHPDEQHVVREIFHRYAVTRAGTRAIADQLNTEGKRTRVGKPWSGHTIGRMLINRLYLGEVGFRDVTTADAHPPIIDPDLFEQCQLILTSRGELGSARAAASSDYHLTGLITCPQRGHKYIGASATGKLRRYRYYTCFSRARYGRSGCTGPRIDAGLMDAAVTDALLDFYTDTAVITAAIAAEQQFRAEHSHQHTAELTAVTSQIRAAEAAVDRYLAAFENATLDETICGHRIRDLTAKIEQLTARRADLTEMINSQPKPPSVDAMSQLRRTLADVLQHGTPGQRKAIIETHIAEIKIRGALLIPIFLVPADDEGPAESSADPRISHSIKVVGRAGLEPDLSRTLRHTTARPTSGRPDPAFRFIGLEISYTDAIVCSFCASLTEYMTR